ncbi:MAG: acryloyl-CoA reductase [Balneola sp.]|nr:MAG: acryloyl-CoA reductase [Balneola sp.]
MSIPSSFSAILSKETNEGIIPLISEVSYSELPDHEVTIRVHYSSLNFKDGLSASGKNRVTKKYPHVSGIDAAGVVIEDTTGTYQPGDSIVINGRDLGTNTWGGFGEIIRVPVDWIVPKPEGFSFEHAMTFGTAGFTAMYGIKRLQRELITPESGPILVTGATGGVGSFAVLGLAQLGYKVVAVSRKKEARDFLTQLGASHFLSPEEVLTDSPSPLLSRKWAGAIDTVGGVLLDALLRQMYSKGAIACCGNVLGNTLETSIYPFILRGVSLLGIDSAFCEQPLRKEIWREAALLPFDQLPDGFYKVVDKKAMLDEIPKILEGKVQGRVALTHQ